MLKLVRAISSEIKDIQLILFINFKNTKEIFLYKWKTILKDSFPFIKLKLFEKNFVEINNPEIRNYLNQKILDDINAHLQSRGKIEERIIYKGYENIKEENDLNYPPYFLFRPVALDIRILI